MNCRDLLARWLGLAVAAGAAAVFVCAPVTIQAAHAAGARPPFQLPFPCGDQWRMDSYDSGHAPALDMVKEPNQQGTNGALLIAPAAGKVNQSFYHSNAGNTIQIDHGGGWFTTYIHLQSRSVSAGQRVQRGQAIGRIGATGPTSNGHPHLHYELAIDTNGDGRASWGFAGSERVPAWFNRVRYGTAPGQTYRNVTSHNCEAGRLDVFARGGSDQLVHKWYLRDDGGWHGWEHLGGVLASAPAAVSGEPGRVDVFARGNNNELVHKWFIRDDGGWRDWQHLGGSLTSAPTAVAWESGRIDVFARGDNRQLIHKWWMPGSGWTGWQDLGGVLASAPTAVSGEPGRIDVFARGNNNELVHKWFIRDDGGWRDWQHLGGSLTSAPTAVAMESGRIDVFARGGSDDLVHKWFIRDDGGWHGWEHLGGVLASAPAAVSGEPGRIDVFARGNNNELVHKWFIRDDGGWRDWQHLGGSLTSAPTAVAGV